jgi:hypothetical protein
MPLTVTRIKGSEFEVGRIKGAAFDILFDATYLTAGEIITPDDLGFVSTLGGFQIALRNTAGTSATTTFLPIFNPVVGSVQLFWADVDVAGTPQAFAEVTNGTDVDGVTFTMVFIGF